jgi:heme-degrading monooxygenase HmoA
MFIAMNRSKVIKGSEAAFENVWLSRDSHLDKVPGFAEFHLLRGPEDHTLHASHTVWKNRATFEAWTKSEAFRETRSRCSWTPVVRGVRDCSDGRRRQGGGGVSGLPFRHSSVYSAATPAVPAVLPSSDIRRRGCHVC